MGEERYDKDSLSLTGAISMGTGVMIGAGIFALAGQVAELAGPWFPMAFLAAAVVSGFSAYSYIKMSNAYPSAGGIGMILQKAYGDSTITGWAALLMAFSMIINESLVARTFGTYVLQPFDVPSGSVLVPVLGVGLILAVFLANVAGNDVIGSVAKVSAILKVGGILLFAGAALWASGVSLVATRGSEGAGTTAGGFIAGVALAILAYKGFTTITNSGGEVENPHVNVGRAIIVSLSICLAVYLTVTIALGSSLPLDRLVQAKDFALAEAARPALGNAGVWFTVGIAIIATTSGLLGSTFAVSRMLAMLTDMRLIPHRHMGMPGSIQTHTLVYTVSTAAVLTLLFDLSRIASLGAIFYLVMDIAIHWGVFRHMRAEIEARGWVMVTAIVLDGVALTAFLVLKLQSDPLIVGIGVTAMAAIFVFERYFLANLRQDERWTEPSRS